jgi:spermidine synthase
MMKFKSYGWPGFFLLLGVISILGQAVLLREMTALFYGNEMFYGLGLGIWLLWVGLGSLSAGRLKFLSKKPLFLWLVLIGWVIFLPILVVLLRFVVGRLVLPGGLPNFSFSFLILSLTLFIFSFPLGALFALSAGRLKINRAYFWETIGFAIGGMLFSFFLATISLKMGLKWRYPHLVKAVNSQYQQIIITQKNKQRNYFLSGQLAFSNQESLENEQLVSLLKPFTGESPKILILGNPNLARKISQDIEGEVFFLEMDRRLLEMEKELLGEGINLVSADPRRFLAQSSQKYDLLVFALGNPQTLLNNRLYTQESLRQIKNCLSENGILVLLSYLPTDYQSQEALRFGSSIYRTLKAVFPEIELLTPEDQLIFLAGSRKLVYEKERIIPKYQDYFKYQINNPGRKEILNKLVNTPSRINTDFLPVTFFYSQLFWQTIFSFKASDFIIKAVEIIPFLLIIIFGVLIWRGSLPWRLGVKAASSSFILMSLEVMLIFLFQSRLGYLYSQVSLIFAAVLVGLGLGVKLREIRELRVANCGLFFLAYLPFLILINQAAFWPLIALGLGTVGGMIFATLNQAYLKKSKNPGFIYAFDLFGGFLGAILTSSFLLPSWGWPGLRGIILAIIVLNLVTAKLRG